jgi:ATP-binding cassette subfamily G (WHITE) protein 2
MYGVTPYFITKLLVTELPTLILAPLLFASLTYYGVGLVATPEQFFTFYVIIFFLGFCANSLGCVVSSMFSRAETAVVFAPLMMMLMMMFSGMMVNLDTLPGWISWF